MGIFPSLLLLLMDIGFITFITFEPFAFDEREFDPSIDVSQFLNEQGG